uniref:Ty3 transposon capsid-like protein domain-containing protein n=1 Tax=Cyprinodon variegatus TaxID=28743 RepID=A0A3Q2G680_CYPVA
MTEHCGQTLSPAGHLRRRLAEQDAQIQGHAQTLCELHTQIELQNQMLQTYAGYMDSANTASAAQPFPGPVPPPRSPAVTSAPEFRPSLPEKFSGNMKDCKGFLFQCRLIFENSPGSFPTDQKKITFILSQLTGRALEWAEARFASEDSFRCDFPDFVSEFYQVFNQKSDQTIDSRALLNLRQGNSSVADFSINFRVKAAASRWNQCALKSAYFKALNDNIKDELATLDEPATLEDLIRLTIRLDNRIRARNSSRQRSQSFSVSAPASNNASVFSGPTEPVSKPRSKTQSLSMPVQVGHTRLTPEERLRRFRGKLCIYCGETGHFINFVKLFIRLSCLSIFKTPASKLPSIGFVIIRVHN